MLDNFVRGRRENLDWARANGAVTLVEGDIRDRALVRRLMEGVDVVFHHAAIRITQCAEEPRLALEVLVDGTYNVFEAAAEPGVRRVVASSSASVYGLAEEFPTREDHHPYANDTLYGAAKVFNEGLLRSMHAMFGLDYVALRYFNVYGPRMDVHGALHRGARALDGAHHGRAAAAHPRRRHRRRWTSSTSATSPARTCSRRESDLTDVVFNVASGTETSLLELAQMLLRVMGSDLRGRARPRARASTASPAGWPTRALAREQLGFEAEVDLEEGLTRLVEWWRGGARRRPTRADAVSLARAA